MKPVRHRRPRRQPLWLVVSLVALGLLAWLLWPRDPYALPSGDWRVFKARFLAADGRVMDDGNGGISHSEGQGYGMLLAVAFRDRAAFDRMWAWTLGNLKRKDDYLFSWKWVPGETGQGGKVVDPNNATDGDLLIAWALLRAYREWDDYKYQQASGQIVISVLEKATVETHLGVQLLPGVVGFSKPEGTVVNPSYYVFPAFRELAEAFPSDRWTPLRKGGQALLETAVFGKWKLSPDWALVAERWVDFAPGHDRDFGYNAIRVPLHLAWDDPESPLLGAFAEFWQIPATSRWVPATVNLRDDSFGPYAALPGMMAVRELTLACVKKTKLTVAQLPHLSTEESYYSAGLKLLVKVAVRERFRPKRN